MKNKVSNFFLLTLCLGWGLYACENDEENFTAPSHTTRFFNAQGADEWLFSIAALLNEKNDSADFVTDFVNEYGYPLWKDAHKFTNAGKVIFAVPIKSTIPNSEIESIWFFSIGYEHTEYRIYTLKAANRIISQIGGDGIEETWMFDYFTLNALHKDPTSGIKFGNETTPTTRISTATDFNCNHLYSYVTGPDYFIYVDHGIYCWGGIPDQESDGGIPPNGSGSFHNKDLPFQGGGGGSGGGTSGTGSFSLSPNADKIFKSIPFDKQKSVEQAINKIMLDCMGEALYKALAKNYWININFVTGYSSYTPTTNTINLNINMESNQLFHEMWHAYQSSKLTASVYNNSTINSEIEAHYAQYLYLKKQKEYNGSKWEKDWTRHPRLNAIKELEKYIDKKGNLTPNKTNEELDFTLNQVASMFETHEYSDDNVYKYNWNIKGTDNFRNLRELAKDC